MAENSIQGLEHASLLVVDVQNDFCPGGNLEVPQGDRIVPVINKLMEHFPNVVATQDWHPAEHISFASNQKQGKVFETITIGDIEQILWPDHCVPGTRGAQFHPQLDTNRFNLILRKGVRRDLDSYSAFYENDKKTSTGLSYYLKGLDMEKVYICGLALDVCVFHTAMDSADLEFATYVIEDAARGVDSPPGSIEKTQKQMKEAGVEFITSDKLK